MTTMTVAPSNVALVRCPHCNTDLTQRNSVVREYINKDLDQSDDGECVDVMVYGHHQDGVFEADASPGFGDARFDLNDDSDKCCACDGQL